MDYRHYLERKGVYGILRVPDGAPVDIVKGNHGNFLLNLILHPIRTWLSSTLKRSHSGQELAFLQAIILGQRSGIEPEILKDFRDAGTLHILAVSGLHVGFIILIIQSLLMLIRFPGRWQPIAIIIFILFYVLITGARAPVLRAGIFASLYYLGISLQRYRDHWNILGMTALVLLLIDPGNLFDPGFQLSFSAVAGILFLTSVLLPEILKIKGTPKPLSIKLDWKEVSFRTIAYLRIPDISIKWDWKKNCLYYIAGYRAPPFSIRSFLKKVFSLFVMSAGAFFGTSLVMAYHFHNLVPGTVIVNMLVVPLATLVVGLGLSELVVGPVIPLFGSYFGGSTEGLIQLIFRINRYAGEFPLMSFGVGHCEVVYVLFSVLFVFIVWALSLKAVRHKKSFALQQLCCSLSGDTG